MNMWDMASIWNMLFGGRMKAKIVKAVGPYGTLRYRNVKTGRYAAR